MSSSRINFSDPLRARKFFMSLRDISLWVRSARTDARLSRLRREHGAERAFDLLYEQLEDPWACNVPHFRYQRLKYDTLLSLIPPRQYRSALDLGCGLGVLTRDLASHADQVLGLDLSLLAVEQARQLSKSSPNVRFDQADVLAIDPSMDGRFDLIVFADTLYYISPLSDEALKRICRRVADLLVPGGILLLAHHYFCNLDPGSRLSRVIHNAFRCVPELKLIREYRKPFYLVSLMEAPTRELWPAGKPTE
jgi:SAM-dependent methyltransferase